MRNLCFLVLLAALSSCNTPPKQPSPAPITFGPAINNFESPEVCDIGFVLFWNFQHILETSDSIVGKFIDPIRLDTLASAEYTGKTLNGPSGGSIS